MPRRRPGRPKNKICIICGEKIEKGDLRILALEWPIYENLTTHRKCTEKYSYKELKKIVKQHIEKSL